MARKGGRTRGRISKRDKRRAGGPSEPTPAVGPSRPDLADLLRPSMPPSVLARGKRPCPPMDPSTFPAKPSAPPGSSGTAKKVSADPHRPTSAVIDKDPTKAIEALAAFEPREVLRCYLAGEHDKAIDLCFQTLQACVTSTIAELTPEVKHLINVFVETFLYLLTRPDVVVSRDQTGMLLSAHHVIGNLVALSDFRTTDPQLAILSRQGRNFGKVVFLYSSLNEQYIDPKQFFDADPEVASRWYATYALGSQSSISERAWRNKKRHLAYQDERLKVPDHRIGGILFGATYVDDDLARSLKLKFNADIRRQIGKKTPRLTPKRDRIAIVSGKWWRGTAVHRSISPLVKTLQDKYHTTLVELGTHDEPSDTDGFNDVRSVVHHDRTLDCKDLRETDFQLAFYPDVGMTTESIWLSNMRIAPIQAVGYGHPTTTGGSLIDFFIGGAEVELAEQAKHFYTERLVLIPGLGAVPVYPDYTPRHVRPDTDRVVINIAWGVAKINYPMMLRLKAIQQRSRRPVAFHFFPGGAANRYCAITVLLREVGEILGSAATVFSGRRYTEYMESLEQGHLSLDSYPFGGYNTVVDALHLGNPIITHEGDRYYNRASSAILRRVGLDELIATSEGEYIEKAVRLVDDDDYREDLRQRLLATDLKACLYEDGSAQYFCKAIDYLIENHERLVREGSREPIFIR